MLYFFFYHVLYFFYMYFFFSWKSLSLTHSLISNLVFFFFRAPEKKKYSVFTHSHNFFENVPKMIFFKKKKKYGTFAVIHIQTVPRIFDWSAPVRIYLRIQFPLSLSIKGTLTLPINTRQMHISQHMTAFEKAAIWY